MRKISPIRQFKLDRIHIRDCPGQTDIEVFCLECLAIRTRRKEAATPILGRTRYVAFLDDSQE